ncbi:MAG TPA: DUF2474 domain-containing protein [Devosia sp.]|jgi:hypothetical protein
MVATKARQWGWFVALWVAGVLSVTAVGLVIRLFVAT